MTVLKRIQSFFKRPKAKAKAAGDIESIEDFIPASRSTRQA